MIISFINHSVLQFKSKKNLCRSWFCVWICSCEKRQSCTIEADSSRFGDSCPNTAKYLEVIYQCQYGTSWSYICFR